MGKDDFACFMNAPQEYRPSNSDIEMIEKIKRVIECGKTVVVKRKTDGSFVVYEESMRKV